MIVNSFAQLMLPNDLHCNHDVYVLRDFVGPQSGFACLASISGCLSPPCHTKYRPPGSVNGDAEKHRLAPTCASHGPTLIVARPMQLFIIKRGER